MSYWTKVVSFAKNYFLNVYLMVDPNASIFLTIFGDMHVNEGDSTRWDPPLAYNFVI